MVKDHSDSERGNPLPPHRQGFFYMHHPIDRIAHTTAFVTPVMEHRPEQPILHVGPIELFLIPVSAPRLVYQRPWYVLSLLLIGKSSPCGSSRFPHLL